MGEKEKAPEFDVTGESNSQVGQIKRDIPGLTPDVFGTDGKLQTPSNFYQYLDNSGSNGEIDRENEERKKQVIGDTIGAIFSLPKELFDDVKSNKKHAWIAFGLGMITISIAGAIEIKRGGRDLRTFAQFAHLFKGKLSRMEQDRRRRQW